MTVVRCGDQRLHRHLLLQLMITGGRHGGGLA